MPGLRPEGRYRLQTLPQSLFISRFGGLVKHILPVALNPNGWVLRWANRLYRMPGCVETYEACGQALREGIPLNTPFVGTGYNPNVRLLGDYGSNLYVTQPVPEGAVAG